MAASSYIVIKTGFENIQHDIEFHPQTMPKGKALVEAQHVQNVEEHRTDGCSFLIKAQIIRQTSVASTPYTTKLDIDSNRKVIECSCTYVYNQSKKCKHVAALIYYINNEPSTSKTNLEQQWGKPSVRHLAQSKYAKGKYFHEMFEPKIKIDIKKIVDIDRLKLKQPSAFHNILAERKKTESDRAAKEILDCVITKVLSLLQQEECTLYINHFFNSSAINVTYSKNYVIDKKLKSFYMNKIILSTEDIIQLCCDTLEQFKCTKWYESRNMRISASRNAHDIKSRHTKPVEKLVADILYPKKLDTAALRYGRRNELIAANEYEKLYSASIKRVGLIVSREQPWLCASLDGISIINSNINKIVEIKCPISCKKIPVIGDKINVNYLTFKGTNVILKESSPYYTQCQVQLYITGLSICDLFVYSPVKDGCVYMPVNRNEKFIENVIHKWEEFYFQFYLPELYKKHCQVNKNTVRCFTGKNIETDNITNI